MTRLFPACPNRPARRSHARRGLLCGLCLLSSALLGGGCASDRGGTNGAASSSSVLDLSQPEPNRRDGTATGVARESEPAVVIEGSTLDWSSLRAPLIETAGAMVLEEIVLDRALEREAARLGLVVGEPEIRAEEGALLDELSSVGADQTRMEVLAQIRRTRGLGPTRYEALLRRNALLRAIVRGSSEPDQAELELARRLAFGETRRVRLFVSSSESSASRARAETLGASPESRIWVFADQAARNSSHPTSVRGGLIERFHPEDPAYPSILGNAARSLEPGGVSPVLSTAAGFAVVMVESIEPGRSPEAGEAERVARRVRQRKERLAMERLARSMIERASVSPIDPDLARAWRDRR